MPSVAQPSGCHGSPCCRACGGPGGAIEAAASMSSLPRWHCPERYKKTSHKLSLSFGREHMDLSIQNCRDVGGNHFVGGVHPASGRADDPFRITEMPATRRRRAGAIGSICSIMSQYRHIWAHGAWRSETQALPTIVTAFSPPGTVKRWIGGQFFEPVRWPDTTVRRPA